MVAARSARTVATLAPPLDAPGRALVTGPWHALRPPTRSAVSLRCMSHNDSDGPNPTPWAPWVRIVALVLIVALVGFYALSLF